MSLLGYVLAFGAIVVPAAIALAWWVRRSDHHGHESHHHAN